MSVVQVKSKPASVALQAPPWNSLFRLFLCGVTRNEQVTKGERSWKCWRNYTVFWKKYPIFFFKLVSYIFLQLRYRLHPHNKTSLFPALSSAAAIGDCLMNWYFVYRESGRHKVCWIACVWVSTEAALSRRSLRTLWGTVYCVWTVCLCETEMSGPRVENNEWHVCVEVLLVFSIHLYSCSPHQSPLCVRIQILVSLFIFSSSSLLESLLLTYYWLNYSCFCFLSQSHMGSR